MATALLISHGLVAVALLGAMTHQTLATWAPTRVRPGSFFERFRTVPTAAFANAIAVLYVVSSVLGAIVYVYFRVEISRTLENSGYWRTLGLFDLKEHFVAIGLALLPAYWVYWQERADKHARTRAAVTLVLAAIVWWSFLIGHITNNIRGFEL